MGRGGEDEKSVKNYAILDNCIIFQIYEWRCTSITFFTHVKFSVGIYYEGYCLETEEDKIVACSNPA